MFNSNRWDDAVFIALGSNLAGAFSSSRSLLEATLGCLSLTGLNVTHRSRWWRSVAWPDQTGPDYLNGVILVETQLAAREIMPALLTFEAKFGRGRDAPNAPRTLDLDLIAFGRSIIAEPGLTVPHPRAAERRFVMGPLADIAPDWRHPVLGCSAASLARSAPIGIDAQPLTQ